MKRDGTLLSLKHHIDGHLDYLPSFVPAHGDRAVATRSTTATAERRQRTLPEQSFVFNLSNEVSMKYSIFTVADSGLRTWQWTSAKLQDNVMYLETHKSNLRMHFLFSTISRERYELTRKSSTPSEMKDSQVLTSCFLHLFIRITDIVHLE